MYKYHLIVICILFSSLLGIGFWYNIELSESLASSLITFSGIIFGFLVTAVSTLYGTNFAAKLHNKVDTNESLQQTMLQTLKNYFSLSATLCLLTIFTIIVCEFIPSYIRSTLCTIALGFTLSNVFILWLLIKVFLRGLEEEAK